MAFSPVQASKTITEQYKRYLSTIFAIDDPDYQRQFAEQLEKPRIFAAGPYLDVSDAFETSDSPRMLVEKGILPQSFLRYRFHQDRSLYRHQQNALTNVLDGHNIVVSTGTGSGKTESFLMPILAKLADMWENGKLQEGVHALLIYPMNALANDQVERLRELLQDFPEIKFGCYTGQTREKYAEAIEEYKKLNQGKTPGGSELISREEMKKHPPHILITNYAMLEYLMVRPADGIFFEDNTWRFIVLDEAHVYRGSTGIEVSMLLRRLRAVLPVDKLQYILTSATLGDEDENQQVADFAAQRVICAHRISVPKPDIPLRLPAKFYFDVREKLESGMSDTRLDRELCNEYAMWNLSAGKALFEAVQRDERYWQIRNMLAIPQSIYTLSEKLNISVQEMEAFVAVASHCEADGMRLFDARYHMFLRATESVFVTLAPSKRLFLNRRKDYIEADGQTYKVFEIFTCSACHAIYLVGAIEDNCLVQCADHSKREVFFPGSSISDTDEDCAVEDDISASKEYMLCSICGHLHRRTSKTVPSCVHGKEYEIPIVQVKMKNPEGELKKCAACEAVNNYGILRSFFTGQEAVTSVIGTALFNALPDVCVETQTQVLDDDFGFGVSMENTSKTEVRQAKQYLCFSDSRQASAYFATYMDTTYRKLLYKRLITESLARQKKEVTMVNFCEDLSALFTECDILNGSNLRAEKESWKAVLAEAAEMGSATSLSSMGLMTIGVDSAAFKANLMLKMSAEEVATLLNVLIKSMLNDVALKHPCPMTEEDKDFYHYGASEARYTLSAPNRNKNIRGFVPTKKNLSNKRLDYLKKVLEKKVPGFPQEKMRNLLQALWNMLTDAQGILVFAEDGYQLDPQKLKILRPKAWYRCTKCNRVTPYFIEGVCPNYKCDGRLEMIDPEKELQNNHYYRLYHDMSMRPLRIHEHTAQLNRDTAYKYQQDFKDKRIDVLSCSTTFEMGVDVGSLETVFMRNMPPLPSNYAQRAGRAGRSKLSAAFALTFCNRSSHDFMYFDNPVDMIKGKIHAPHFNVINEKIAIRHLYASAMAFFWKIYPEYFSTVENLAQSQDTRMGMDGVGRLKEYLLKQPAELKTYLREFLPKQLYDQFGCENFEWITGLIGEPDGKLTLAISEYKYEVDLLRDAVYDAYCHHRSTGYLEQRIRNYEQESVLSFLSRRNVMPQYGFPVDTVSLQINSRRNDVHYGVELQRDLAVAIAEYAPESQVVANGKMFTGRYIKKMPKIGWKMYDFIKCPQCDTLNIEPNTGINNNENLCKCKVCRESISTSDPKTFLVPAFGFETDPNKVCKPGLIRPKRTYRGDVSYIGYRQEAQNDERKLGKALVSIQFSGKDEMAVLNTSDFYVCESCGYAQTDPGFMRWMDKEHDMPNGRKCSQKKLRRLSLGYRFETDVFQLNFLLPSLERGNESAALSVLNGLLRGISRVLDVEEQDVSGCLRCFFNQEMNRFCYRLIFYDTTPGGAGHVKRLFGKGVLERVIEETLTLMKRCLCGGETGDSSCYACLRSYQNQKDHDRLKRSEVISFLNNVLP